jgi:hypothetical protein
MAEHAVLQLIFVVLLVVTSMHVCWHAGVWQHLCQLQPGVLTQGVTQQQQQRKLPAMPAGRCSPPNRGTVQQR